MIFKTIDTKIEKKSYDITIKNIDIANYHWGSEKIIIENLDTVETLYMDKSKFDKQIVIYALELMKFNHRVQDAKFYRIPEENKLILFITSEIPKFKEYEPFSKEMSILLKHEKFTFSIIELVGSEIKDLKDGKIAIPASWQLDEKLTDRLSKLKDYV